MESSAMNTTAIPVEHLNSGLTRHDPDAAEQMRNRLEIESMARQLERPFTEIAELYATIYTDLKSHAHVTDYLPVFVARRIRASLSKH
jgi:hypothetical protein